MTFASRRFQPGEGPSRGLLRDCTTSPINRFAALNWIIYIDAPHKTSMFSIKFNKENGEYFAESHKSSKLARKLLGLGMRMEA